MDYEKRFRECQRKHKLMMVKHLELVKQELYTEKPMSNNIEKSDNICEICGKELKNKHGVAIHKGKVHKVNKQTIITYKNDNLLEQIGKQIEIDKQISFDKDGKYIPEKITRDYPKNKKPKIEKRTFFCNKHNRFHKHLFHGKPSTTYIKCLFKTKTVIDKDGKKHKIPNRMENSDNFYKFKDDIDNYQLFIMDFKNKWNRESKKGNRK